MAKILELEALFIYKFILKLKESKRGNVPGNMKSLKNSDELK